jgi:hypothetical protein
LIAANQVEIVELGAARSKPLCPNVRHRAAVFEVEVVDVRASRNKPLDPNSVWHMVHRRARVGRGGARHLRVHRRLQTR